MKMKIFYIIIVTIFFNCKKKPNIDSKPIWDYKSQIRLYDFENEIPPKSIKHVNSSSSVVEDNNSDKVLKIKFNKDEKFSSLAFTPKEPWKLDPSKKYCFVYDAKSIGKNSAFITIDVYNGAGKRTRRIVSIYPESFKSYFFELTTQKKDIDSGLRDTSPAWDTDAVHMKINGLLEIIDFSEISKIKFYSAQGYRDKTLLLKNIRIVESPKRDSGFLKGIVDRYGQNAKKDFPLKIKSDEELKSKAAQELRSLSEYTLMPDRSQYGGWKDGPKLKATGFFRKEKYEGKWALVDPDGYLYFSNGLANVRMANTTTYTGIDYTDNKIKFRDPEDVTPEDSKGIVDVPLAIKKTGHVINKLRNDMFVELPPYDDPLANHYSYRKESHFGSIEHGQTFSFYSANLERRYGEEYPNSFIDKWLEVTENRMRNWGFTSFGNWIDPAFYNRNKVPYFANGWIIGDFQKLYSGQDYWGPMADPFDPEFARRAKKSIDIVAAEVKNNPWCIGVFIDNEKSWGSETSIHIHYGLVLDGLSKGMDSFIKQKFIKTLKSKYININSLNKSWETNISSWTMLENGLNYKKRETFSIGMIKDLSLLLETLATKYFQVIHDALKEKMPNHLYLGCRFSVWGVSSEVRKSAAKFVDVMSYNYYKEGIGEKYWMFLEEVDMPTLIGEYHIGAKDSGLFHSGLIHATDQKDRARMWKDYIYSVIDNPYFVGAHWFQYLDSPLTGRAHDGENYNVGFVSNTDIPYPEMVKAAKEVNTKLYTRRFNNNHRK